MRVASILLALALLGGSQCHAGALDLTNILASADALQQPLTALPLPPSMEVRPLMEHGPPENRVDLMFFSDGYLPSEKAQFFADAQMLAQGLIAGNKTYNSVAPLLNMWAAFTPSGESGIGWGGVPKNTTYGLYRDGSELRAVYVGKPEVNVAACKALDARCDYPIIVGNSPLYGGLESRHNEGATTITKSPANGVLVLRHELGHSIPDVGEEYDGGGDDGYYGANTHAGSGGEVKWAHWLDNDVKQVDHGHALVDHGDDDEEPGYADRGSGLRPQRATMPLQAYPWTLLNTTAPWSATFASSGAYARALVRFSLSGIPEASDARVMLDGKDLGWTPKAGIEKDRWHYDLHVGGLEEGEHEVTFALVNEDREGEAQLCNVEVLEFGDEDEFDARSGVYGLFPTFGSDNVTRYRPTNEDCLMRLVTAPGFCNVCLESLWLTLLARVDLIDGVDEVCAGEGMDEQNVERTTTVHNQQTEAKHGQNTLSVRLISLGQLRGVDIGVEERYSVVWSKDGVAVEDLTDNMTVAVGEDETWTVDVTYLTEEVRKDEDGRTRASRTVKTSQCS
ncbi:IgA peptidase M64-domain-containing protein [Schizophyllum commune]